jgi:glyoxylase-like metal-dependent hydrolase (beta-lactamase superfamily II)
MNLNQIAPGLYYWTAPHPDWNGATDWPENVGCVFYESPNAAVVIDPLLPRGEEDQFWTALDALVARHDSAVAVLLTAPWHQRSASLVAERYGSVVWAHEAGHSRLTCPARSGPLPEGVELFVPDGDAEGQVAFYLRLPRALVVAEFFSGMEGGLKVLTSPAQRNLRRFNDSLRQLLELPIDHVLVAHGEPVLNEGRRRIAEALGVDA